MNEHEATEIAFKNGYNKAVKEIFEDIKSALAQMGIVFYSQPILYEIEKKYTGEKE